jgi:hypothetical protein
MHALNIIATTEVVLGERQFDEYNIEIPWWQVIVFLLWMISFGPTLFGLASWWLGPVRWGSCSRPFLIAGILACPFAIYYTLGAIEDAFSRFDFGMLPYAAFMILHVALCAWRYLADRTLVAEQ